MTVDFVNHHVHSHFSVLDGMATPDVLVERAVAMGQKSISLTDHGTMSGIPSMYRAAKKAGIGMTPGCEMYYAPNRFEKHLDRFDEKYYHLILLAISNQGYDNLMKLNTAAWEDGYYYKPRVDYELMDRYSDGIVATTACLGGMVNKMLMMGDMSAAERELGIMADIYGRDNLYIEIQRNGDPTKEKILKDQVELSRRSGIPLLATADSHYATKGDRDYHDTLICSAIKAQKYGNSRNSLTFDGDYHLFSGDEMSDLFPADQFPGAISNTVELAERTDFTMKIDDDKEYLMPRVDTEDGLTESETLREHVLRGAREMRRYGNGTDEIPDHVMERIDYELGVVERMGFDGYFLIVEKIVKKFAEEGIYVGPGRGCLSGDTPVMTQRGWVPIKDVKIGDRVLTHDGSIQEVLDTPEHDTVEGEELVRLRMENGESISLTENHKVLTHSHSGYQSWQKASNIGPGDLISFDIGKNVHGFETFNPYRPVGSASEISDAEFGHVKKDSQWGYATGVLASRGLLAEDGSINVLFTEDEADLSGAFFNSLNDALNDSPVIDFTVDSDGEINSVRITSDRISHWFEDFIAPGNPYIGLGNEKFTRGYIQAVQQCCNSVNDMSNIECHDSALSDSVRLAMNTLMLRPKVDCDGTVSVKNYRVQGTQSVNMVASVEKVPAPEKVYDLTVANVHSFLTSSGIVHNSAPGSVVVYCLGITNVDPFSHDLYFERFLNPDRISMPDIDIDIPRSRRKEALRIMEREFGKGHVAHLSNYSTMGMRMSLERVSKVFGLSPSEARKLTSAVADYCESYDISLREFYTGAKYNDKDVRGKLPKSDFLLNIIDHAAKLEGVMSNNGVHACGIVITNTPVDEHFPIRLSDQADLPICQYDGADTEALGGVKMDILGLVNLDECEDAEKNIRLDLGEDVDSSSLPLDDEAVYETISRGEGGGIFQLGCVAGDTRIITEYGEETIKSMWHRRNSTSKVTDIRSVYLGEGFVHKNYVHQVVYSGKKQVYRMTVGDRSIRATADHKFFTDNGWKALGDIVPGEDSILLVDDKVGNGYLPNTIRGKQDILDVFFKDNPDYVQEARIHPVTVGETTFYPSGYHKDHRRDMVVIYPDISVNHARKCEEIVSQVDDGRTLKVYSYSEVLESHYSKNDRLDIETPFGSAFTSVKSIEKSEVTDTYDIMMYAPVHNFIAEGMMVHNSSGIRSLSRSMKPTEFSDISSLLALYRPGPMGYKPGGPDSERHTHEEYCYRKNNPSAEMSVLHPEMAEILSKTYNLVVYQEDLMSLARHFGGYTGGEADELRKAVAKKIPAKMEAQRKKLIPAVSERYGGTLGQDLWDIIEPFGKYAFCKAHSTAYAMTSYRTAWLKSHYPAQFAAAVFDAVIGDGGNKDKIMETMVWVRESGIEVNNPDVNSSDTRTTTTRESLTLPLDFISGVGARQSEEIINERKKSGPFRDVVDFAARTGVPEGLLVKITKAGGFDSMGVGRAKVIENAPNVISMAKTIRSTSRMKTGLFGSVVDEISSSTTIDLKGEIDNIMIDNRKVQVDDELYGKWEREVTGVILGPHPFEAIRNMRVAQSMFSRSVPVDRVTAPGRGVSVVGVITGASNNVSGKGNSYCKFELETELASMPVLVFQHLPLGDDNLEGTVVVATGNIDNDSGSDDEEDFKPKMICSGLRMVDVERMKRDEEKLHSGSRE